MQARSAAAGADDVPLFTEEDYKIGVDDQVQVSVWRQPDLGITVPVRPDGKISVPLIGEVFVGGKTPREVAEEIRVKLSRYIRDPNVSVIITAMNSNEYLTRVRITGAVRTPTSLVYRRGMTVLDVILAAGGVSDFAAPNRTKLYRRTKEGTRVYRIRLQDILEDGELETNMELLPGDVITVPESVF
ncbi:MAG TPA: sugar ABC transporter substrate-binding protein [Gammaproteobacteria bacterium]|nr:sugar ABC transporter substrate-binding protein [Gammaproteobacteria bacterium]